MNKEVEILTIEEIGLLNEMKKNCLNGGKYKDEKAKDKFYMLCHLEDFVIKHDDLHQENQELKTKIKELVKYAYGTEMSLGEFKGFYKLAIGKEYEPKKGIEVEQMISGANEEQLELANDRADILLLQQENQSLKKQLEEYKKELEKADSITQSCIFNGKKESEISYRKCLNMLENLKEKNKELKKQLEEKEELQERLTKYQILHRDCKVDNLKNISKIEKMEYQQKEFIEYLEYQVKLQEELNDIHLATGFEEILSKYKKIIGNDK